RRHTTFSRDWSSDVCSSDLSSILHLLRGAAGQAAANLIELFKRLVGDFHLTALVAGKGDFDLEAELVGDVPLKRQRVGIFPGTQIGRASCRERVESRTGAGA